MTNYNLGKSKCYFEIEDSDTITTEVCYDRIEKDGWKLIIMDPMR